MPDQIEAAAPTAANPKTSNLKDTSISAQRQRILEWLRRGPATTIELRAELDVMMPGARIFELRHKLGYEIHTTRVQDETKPGHSHSVAKYSLIREATA